MKKCPFCAEEIQDEAIVCRFCGRELQKVPIFPSSAPIAPPEKKRTPWAVIILGLLAIILCVAVASTLKNGGGGGISKSTYEIKYEITGTSGSGSITYENAFGDTEQVDDVRIPYSKVQSMSRGDFVYISVQNNNESGSVTCKIYVDGVVVKTSTSTGAYVIATCSGKL